MLRIKPTIRTSKFSTSCSSLNSLSTTTLKSWNSKLSQDPVTQLTGTVLQNLGPQKPFVSRDARVRLPPTFNVSVQPELKSVRNQKQSGRCWLFAACNVVEREIAKTYGSVNTNSKDGEKKSLEGVEVSKSYLFYWDKLEKANWFLDQISKLDQSSDESNVDGRLVQTLLKEPISDGGQYDMFVNIVNKYGLVPKEIYPESHSSESSNHMNEILTTHLRSAAREILETSDKNTKLSLKQKYIESFHRLLTMFLGTPPDPDTPFEWTFQDGDKTRSVITTPRFFAPRHEYISLLNDPRNKYSTLIRIPRLGNVVGQRSVHHVNIDPDTFESLAVASLQANYPLFFGIQTPYNHDYGSGLIDQRVWLREQFRDNAPVAMTKAQRLKYGESCMTHAMVLSAVHLDNGKPSRWKVENSWGDKATGHKFGFVMGADGFKDEVYQIVVRRELVPDEILKIWDGEAGTDLPLWDPCGSLAN